MSRKLPHTPISRIRAALGTLWLRSRERAAAIKREGNRCQDCGAKGSVAKGREVKIEVDHISPVGWSRIARIVREELLVEPAGLRVLCKGCHAKKTALDAIEKANADIYAALYCNVEPGTEGCPPLSRETLREAAEVYRQERYPDGDQP